MARKKAKKLLSPADASAMRLKEGFSEIICRHMNQAVKDGLDPLDTWDCEYVRSYYRAIMPELFKYWREGPWVTMKAEETTLEEYL